MLIEATFALDQIQNIWDRRISSQNHRLYGLEMLRVQLPQIGQNLHLKNQPLHL